MAQIPGTVIAAQITTGDTANTFSIGDTNQMQGGHQSVAFLEERDAITDDRRREGMTCWVAGTTAMLYRLVGGTDNASWREVVYAGTLAQAAYDLASIGTNVGTNAYDLAQFAYNLAAIGTNVGTNAYNLATTGSNMAWVALSTAWVGTLAASVAQATADGKVDRIGDTMTGTLTCPNVFLGVDQMIYAGTEMLDFAGAGYRVVTATGTTIHFTGSNYGLGRSVTVEIIPSVQTTFSADGSWRWIGGVPSSLAQSKITVFSLTSFGSTGADVVGAYLSES